MKMTASNIIVDKERQEIIKQASDLLFKFLDNKGDAYTAREKDIITFLKSKMKTDYTFDERTCIKAFFWGGFPCELRFNDCYSNYLADYLWAIYLDNYNDNEIGLYS